MLFSLRSAFVQILQAKAVLQVAKDNLEYYDHVLKVSRDRFQAGDIAQIDLDRLELQRVQYESDAQAAEVNLRTSKIELLMLLNDRTPVEEMDAVGVFDFNDQVQSIDDVFRNWHFLVDNGVEIEMGPGRHPQSTAVFLYFLGPEGFTYEYSYGVRLITDEAAWRPRTFDPDEPGSIDMWLGPTRRVSTQPQLRSES